MMSYTEEQIKLRESLPPEVTYSKVIERVLLGVDKNDVLILFRDKVKQFENFQYSEKYIIDGKEQEIFHAFLFLEPPQNNTLKVREVITQQKGKGKINISIQRNALKIQVWQIGSRVKIAAEFFPFFGKMVMDELSNFEQLPQKENESGKDESPKQSKQNNKKPGHICKVPDSPRPLEKWLDVYHYYLDIGGKAKNMRAREFYAYWGKDDFIGKPTSAEMPNDIQRLQLLIDEGNLGHIDKKAIKN